MYFDNSATSYPKPECVYQAVMDYMKNLGTSPGRGTYAKAEEANRLLFQTRKAAAKLFGAPRPSNIVFTANSTEAINLVVKGVLGRGDHVITTSAEHNAVWRPLKKLEQSLGVVIHTIPCSPDGSISVKDAESLKSPDIKLAVFVHSSNVIGSIFPIGELIEIAHKNGVPVLIDASQTAGCVPIDVTKLGVDYLAFTGHKGLMGPTGTGGLYIRDGVVLDTLKEGGTGSMAVSPLQPDDAPDRYEAGTINMAGLAGLKAALEFIDATGIEEISRHKQNLISKLMTGLQSEKDITMYGPPDGIERSGLLSINIGSASPYDIAALLDKKYGIMTRAGLHCAPQAHRVLGTVETGTLRISVGYFNTEEQIDALVSALKEITQELRIKHD